MDYKLIWWVFALPLFGSLFQALGGKIVVDTFGPKLGRRICGALGVAPIALAFLIALPMTLQLMRQPESERAVVLTLFEWISTQAISIPFEFRVDPLSMTMVLVITGIGSLIHLYSIGYMSEEPDFPRFFTYLNLFIALMLVLVLGNNLAMLFIGWEGVGLCSYLLIGFWYKDLKNSAAANKAFIVNRIGDVGLTLGMFWLVVLAAQNKDALGIVDSRWLSYDVLLPQIGQLLASKPFDATMIALLLFVGACGKSAQFPLFVWLPDAMAGPTPVSALIHAATMVTSGIVLLNRTQEIFLASPFAMNVVALVGAATAVLGAGIAFGHTDIKKVLAYSTVSQLGFMFIACGVGAFYAGMFHVITHAFFKALLFLGSGAVIHAMAHDQDMRNYGRLQKYLPITYLTMGIGWAAIAGVPFLFSGFWSKEAVLYNALNMPDKMSTFTIA
ncbi:MAG: NADH-quinone oxidoreductase subunit L, partial [Armatimonadota bacterium]